MFVSQLFLFEEKLLTVLFNKIVFSFTTKHFITINSGYLSLFVLCDKLLTISISDRYNIELSTTMVLYGTKISTILISSEFF